MSERSSCYHDAILRIAGHVGHLLDEQFPSHRRLIIANRTAGTGRRHHEACRAVAQYFGSGVPTINGEQLVWTHSVAHAVETMEKIVDGRDLIVVSIGGDGTHNGVLSAVLDARHKNVAFVRVPVGSGNDSTSVGRIGEYLSSLGGALGVREIPAVEVQTRRRRLYSFNIASLGIDAYVTDLHDKWRRRFPGNTYRIAADLAVLRFEKNVGLGPSRLIGTTTEGTEVDMGAGVRNLIVFGAEGGRTYGDHMRVLPGEENVCIIGTAGLLEKIRIKKLFFSGRHGDLPVTTMARLESLRVEYAGRLPLQVDGEAHWIDEDEFPVTFSRIERSVTVINATS